MTIYVDGLERSGNTFLGAALTHTLDTEVVTLWSHRVSTLEKRDLSSPFIVPLRDVLPCIVSAKIYRDYTWKKNLQTNERTGDPDELIGRYSEYIDYLTKNDGLFIAPFSEFTRDHNSVIDTIVKNFAGNTIKQRLTSQEVIDLVKKRPILNNAYLGNFPRESAEEKEETMGLFLSDYKKDIDNMQDSVDKLYQRYYDKV